MADEPVTRAELERALRTLNLRDTDIRDALLQLAARVVVLTDELTRRLDGVEPMPALPNTPAPVATATIEHSVNEQIDATLVKIRAADLDRGVALDVIGDKYTTPVGGPNCAELLHLCNARCCTFTFPLSTVDLDEGVIRWDYAKPYTIRQRASDGYCVHNDAATHTCTVHGQRPRVCRVYDCRTDKRIWADFDQRIPADPDVFVPPPDPGPIDLVARVRRRQQAIAAEEEALRDPPAKR
ncbi:MAG TPA: YkgJ family cysteine cluster protein [Kofleriaceae bacterium]|nr:YkgJ family cysteine cluster protein [Kofleriaceae bacterium]